MEMTCVLLNHQT